MVKGFDQFMNESKKFKSSRQATEYMIEIQNMLEDKKLKDWAQETSPKAVKELNNTIKSFNQFFDILDED